MRKFIALGITLGAAAFLPDLMSDAAAPYATPLVSSGFAWGVVALYAGHTAKTPRSAAVTASAVLILATIVYYGLILFVSQRWMISAENSEDGLPSYAGLHGLVRTFALWMICGAAGGAVIGSLGHAMRVGQTRLGSVAAGLAAGLLAGQACFTLVFVRSIWSGPLDAFDLSKLVPSLAQILLTATVMALLLAPHWRAMSIRWFGLAAAASLTVSILIWYLITWARAALY
ncbi:hypothetical protein Rhe02_62720 [Rhizocola hellebori]|uniref:Uncharacterized protein n=1 Tax=Rhizocola hellebori TaxID=1392758 RepID=A0A8J3QCN7_9ACTN|nr:DUF6518 family protein [Rhizocola hellebori]GIH08205.1 hypothetical protein Rhe02_62720 [Rhizocola hellebori]